MYFRKGGVTMEQGERVKAVRKDLNMTLESFGKRLGVTKTAISNIENGARCLTDQMLLAICREFNVNENWLRTGEGDMFLKLSRDDEIAAYVGRVMADENAFYQQKLLLFLSRLSPEMLQKLESVADEVLSESKKEQKD